MTKWGRDEWCTGSICGWVTEVMDATRVLPFPKLTLITSNWTLASQGSCLCGLDACHLSAPRCDVFTLLVSSSAYVSVSQFITRLLEEDLVMITMLPPAGNCDASAVPRIKKWRGMLRVTDVSDSLASA